MAKYKASSTTSITNSNNSTLDVNPSAAKNTCNNVAQSSGSSSISSDHANTAADIMTTPATTLLGHAHEIVSSKHNASDTRYAPSTVSTTVQSDTRSVAIQDWEPVVSPNTAPSAGGFSASSSTGRAGAAATELFCSGVFSSFILVRSSQY